MAGRGRGISLVARTETGFCDGEININYHCPAVLAIDSEITQLNGKSGIIAQRVLLAGEETVVADSALTFVCIDLQSQKAVPLEGELRQRLTRLMA